MKTLRNTAVALLAAAALAAPAGAAVISDLGVNPSSAAGNFSNSPGAGVFSDQVQFQLVGGLQHLTIASVTNTFASVSDFIAGFTASVFNYGADGLFQTADDVEIIGPVAAGPCAVPFCQGMAGSGLLNSGLYYAQFSGIAGSTAGYAGNISTSTPAPIPIPAAGLLLIAGVGALGLLKRRKTA